MSRSLCYGSVLASRASEAPIRSWGPADRRLLGVSGMNLLVDLLVRRPEEFQPLLADLADDPGGRGGAVLLSESAWDHWVAEASEPDDRFTRLEAHQQVGWWVSGIRIDSPYLASEGSWALLPDDDSSDLNVALFRWVTPHDRAPQEPVLQRLSVPAEPNWQDASIDQW